MSVSVERVYATGAGAVRAVDAYRRTVQTDELRVAILQPGCRSRRMCSQQAQDLVLALAAMPDPPAVVENAEINRLGR